MKVLMLLTSILLLGACAITPVVPPTVKSVSGTYQGMKYGSTYKLVLLESGVAEAYTYGKNGKIEDIQKAKWKLAAGEIFSYDEGTGGGRIFRINKDDSLTRIARTGKGGKREDYPKEEQTTYKKIK
tara:strand:+ start:112 stop:492 length:381 start_codon:yes stop_codon:yes gene_type:complete